MTTQRLRQLRNKLRDLSDDSLAQFYYAVVEEVRTRKRTKKQRPKSQGFWETKDCDPIRGY